MPIVLATKLRHSMPEMGQFCLMDADSSFNHGMLIAKGDKMQVINLQVKSEEATVLKASFFEVTEVPVDKTMGFGRGVGIRVRNQEADQYKEISVEEGFSL